MSPILAILSDEPMPLPLALLVLAALYTLPAASWFLVWRGHHPLLTVVVAAAATGSSAFVSRSFFPRSREEIGFWLLVAGIPLAASLTCLVFACKRRGANAANPAKR